MHVSSTEPASFHHMGEVSTLPEKYGVDFLWWANRSWHGAQRKEVKDLMASIRDGRLGKELRQMAPLRHALLVVEGQVDVIGEVVTSGRSQVPLALWDAVVWGVQDIGVKVVYTRTTYDTELAIDRFEKWSSKVEHHALSKTRDAVPVNSWGKSTSRDYQIHLLTGLPGVGDGTAKRMLDHFGGVPMAWTVTEEELCQVDGIGKVKARKMMEALNGTK